MGFANVVNIVVQELKDEQAVEGIFLFGPAATAAATDDDSSEIGIGIATRDNLKDYRKVYGLGENILSGIGKHIALVEDDEEHTHTASALFGKVEYPPLGLKVNLIFSQLKHLADKMPTAGEIIVFDRNAGLAALPEKHAKSKSKDDITTKLKDSLNRYPFYVYDIARAFGLKDHARVQSTAELMRKAIFHVAAVRAGHGGHGVSYGLANLAPGEKWIVEQSYQMCNRKTVQKLTDLYIACLTDVQTIYRVEPELLAFKEALLDLP